MTMWGHFARSGNMEMVRWLYAKRHVDEKNPLTPEERYDMISYAGYHFPVLQWLHETLVLTLDDLSHNFCDVLRHAIGNRRKAHLEWMDKTFGIRNIVFAMNFPKEEAE